MKKGYSKNRHFIKGYSKKRSNTPLLINMTINVTYKNRCNEGVCITKENMKWTKIVGIIQLVGNAINWIAKLIGIF